MTLTLAILAALLALVFLALGTAKILALAPMRERAAEAGFSTAAYRRIGVLEIAGAAGLLAGLIEPLIGALAGTGLLLLLGGALVVHLRNGDGPRKFIPSVICGLLAAVYLMLQFGATR